MLVPQMPTTLLLGSKSLVGLQGTVTNTRDLSNRLCRTEYEGAAVRVGNDPEEGEALSGGSDDVRARCRPSGHSRAEKVAFGRGHVSEGNLS